MFDALCGPLHDQLSDMMNMLGVMESPRMIVTGHYDGNILAKIKYNFSYTSLSTMSFSLFK